MRLSQALKDERSQYNERHDEVISQQDIARPMLWIWSRHLGNVVMGSPPHPHVT